MRGFRNLDPGEEPPEEEGEEVFRVTAWSGGVIGLYLNDDSPVSLFDVANILHDMSVDIAKYMVDYQRQAREN
jgi:hypothetical protein